MECKVREVSKMQVAFKPEVTWLFKKWIITAKNKTKHQYLVTQST